jgi:hypothetical protein
MHGERVKINYNDIIIYEESISHNLKRMLHTSKTSKLSKDCEELRPKHVAAIINKLVLNIIYMY